MLYMALYTRLSVLQRFLISPIGSVPTHQFVRRQRYSYLVYTKIRNELRHVTNITYNCLGLHTTATFFKRRKTAEEKKSHRIIEYAPKAQGDIVDVWRDITAGELARVLNKDFSFVRDIFLNVIKSPDTVISDIKFLQQGIRRSGRRMRIIAKPNLAQEEEIIEKDAYPRPPAPKSALKARSPVVTVMGHVDHGKTTLLDALRHSSVVDQEFGGITQHIGAFSVTLDSGAKITFLDTPGHAAFTAMRARGASLTDIVVLVVAADDGVMEQTVESVRMAREAQVPILVAINKIDSPKADIERTERMLLDIGIAVEKLGGDIQAIPISALKKRNLGQLVEALVLQADLLEIGADPTGSVEAVVVESKVHPHRGKLCTVVVQRGTMSKGNILVAGTAMAKVRVLRDQEGRLLDEVSPGYPAEIEGWRDLPPAGELVLQVETEKRARDVIRIRQAIKNKEKGEQDLEIIAEKQAHHHKEYRDNLMMKRRLGRFKLKPQGPRQPEIPKDDNPIPTLNLVVKGDVDGTVEALLSTLETYDESDCKLDLVHYGVGAVTENDVELAKTFKGIIYAFNVDCPKKVQELASVEDVPIKHHNVIYKLVDDVKEEINGRLTPKEVEDIIGEAAVLQQFEINVGRKKVPVAGCRCTKGVLRKSALYKLIRNGEVIYEGALATMKHQKDDVDTIKTDTECGLQLADKSIIFEPGDTLVCFQKKKEMLKTQWDPGF